MSEAVRIANCSGFYGDRLEAAREMVEGGPIDVLTGDYLAELTLSVLHRDRQADPRLGYAKTFPAQLREVAAACLERGIRIVVNAGGLNPAGCADVCRTIYRQLGLEARVAHIEGDDLEPRLGALRAEGEAFAHLDRGDALDLEATEVLSANAYLGGWGIARALELGADLVICPRVADASLVTGPAAWRFGWAPDDWDRLAAAVVAGHVLECGAQATGGNFPFFRRVGGLERPGFPIAAIAADGRFTVTKHPGTGGEVSVDTVTAQLLYEIEAPRYVHPDVTARFDTVRLYPDGPDRVRVTGVRGEPPPATAKVGLNLHGGYANRVTFLLAGLEVEAKARLAEDTLWARLGGRDTFADSRVTLHRARDAESSDASFSFLTVAVRDDDAKKVGRRFSAAAVAMALASYPGFNLTAPPGRERALSAYWPTAVARETVVERVVFADRSHTVSHPPFSVPAKAPAALPVDDPPAAPSGGPTEPAALGRVCGARSGDKGGNANLGVWTSSDEAFAWLCAFLTVDRLRELIPEARPLTIDRHLLPNLRALNFVLHGLLGDGVGTCLAVDPQAKALGEILRAKTVPIPTALL